MSNLIWSDFLSAEVDARLRPYKLSLIQHSVVVKLFLIAVTVAVLHPVAVSYDSGPIFGALIAEDDPVIAVIFPCALLYHAVIAQRQVADHIVEVGGIKILAPGVEHDQTLAADRLHRRAGTP